MLLQACNTRGNPTVFYSLASRGTTLPLYYNTPFQNYIIVALKGRNLLTQGEALPMRQNEAPITLLLIRKNKLISVNSNQPYKQRKENRSEDNTNKPKKIQPNDNPKNSNQRMHICHSLL